MANEVGSRVSVRLDANASKKLQTMVEQTGKTKSEVIVALINQDCQTCIIDGRKIAAELHELRLMLKQDTCIVEHKKTIENLCTTLIEEIYKKFANEEV